jgi:hypothetical protein
MENLNGSDREKNTREKICDILERSNPTEAQLIEFLLRLRELNEA